MVKRKRLDDIAMQNLLTLLLFRLGGEQTFTQEEVTEISQTVGGATFSVDPNGLMILRCRTSESMATLRVPRKKKVPTANN